MKIGTKFRCGLSVLTAVVAILFAGIASAQTVQNSQPNRTVIPLAEPQFEGTIGETYK